MVYDWQFSLCLTIHANYMLNLGKPFPKTVSTNTKHFIQPFLKLIWSKGLDFQYLANSGKLAQKSGPSKSC